MDQLKKNDDNIAHLRSKFTTLDSKVDSLMDLMVDLSRFQHIRVDRKSIEPQVTKVESSRSPEEKPRTPTFQRKFSSPEHTRSDYLYQLPNGQALDIVDETSAGVSIHIDHNTGVHRLLKWPVIAKLLSPKEISENYVMENEERKGQLRIYGKGQGIDRYDGAQSSSGSSSTSSAVDEDSTRNYGSSSDDELWGFELGIPHVVDGRFFNNEKDHPGGLTLEGNLKLDFPTMCRLLDSYLQHIHILHPFLDRTRLRRMVEKVSRKYSPSDAYSNHTNSASPLATSSIPLKRKHSTSGESPKGGGHAATPIQTPPEPKLARRISTAIVLLVMALGKICQHTSRLPGFASDFSPDGQTTSHSTPQNANVFSPRSTVSSPMSAVEMRGVSIHSRASGSDTVALKIKRRGDRNVDVVPGLAYFAKATEILGALQGNELQFVQANLLAGIYAGQLARVLDSWTFIQSACRACFFLVRDPTFAKEKDSKRVNLIRFAYWACLQLESDILAELDLHPSGIQMLDSYKIGLPKGVVEDTSEIAMDQGPANDTVTVFYSHQLFLRKVLNEWQKVLYPSESSDSADENLQLRDPDYSLANRTECESTLMEFRDKIVHFPELHWNDTDAPAADINAARLRGKFYGARYIVHRPWLYHALHSYDQSHLTDNVMKGFRAYEQDPSLSKLNGPPPNATLQEREDWKVLQVLISCRMCVEAAKCSTLAFDGIISKRRLVVTSIFTTAHA